MIKKRSLISKYWTCWWSLEAIKIKWESMEKCRWVVCLIHIWNLRCVGVKIIIQNKTSFSYSIKWYWEYPDERVIGSMLFCYIQCRSIFKDILLYIFNFIRFISDLNWLISWFFKWLSHSNLPFRPTLTASSESK